MPAALVTDLRYIGVMEHCRFYEKVVKVKDDVAAILNVF